MYNASLCVEKGHTLVALLNLYSDAESTDSFMYQTVGKELAGLLEECTGVPIKRRRILGSSINTSLSYDCTARDEVEDMYEAIKEMQAEYDFEAVAVGAIASTYQRVRVESVCRRLGLEMLALLWGQNQRRLLQEMISSGMHAVVVKASSLHLNEEGLGKDLPWIYNTYGGKITRIMQRYKGLLTEEDFNMCGEGGEYETFTLDCPLYKKRLEIVESVAKTEPGNEDVRYLVVHKYIIVPKT